MEGIAVDMPGEPPRNEHGRYESKAHTDAIISCFTEGRPFHTAQEVADQLGVDRSTAYRWLSQLAEEGVIEKVDVGARTVVWWYNEDAKSDDEDAIRADDPFFSGGALFDSDDPVKEEDMDDVIYSEIEG